MPTEVKPAKRGPVPTPLFKLPPWNWSIYSGAPILLALVWMDIGNRWMSSKRKSNAKWQAWRTEYYRKRALNDPDFRKKKVQWAKDTYRRNKDKVHARSKKWIEKNKRHYQDWQANWHRDKRANDPHYTIGDRLRTRIVGAIRQQSGRKAFSTINLVGCSVSELRAHLDAGFGRSDWVGKKRMFHIDHYVPCKGFNLQNHEHQRICFNWRNLCVASQYDNISKNDSIPADAIDRIKLICTALSIDFEKHRAYFEARIKGVKPTADAGDSRLDSSKRPVAVVRPRSRSRAKPGGDQMRLQF